MRSARAYQCRRTAPVRLLTVPEYALIRPPVPVIPGKADEIMRVRHPRPAYVPAGSTYVSINAQGGFTRLRKMIITGCALLFTVTVLAVMLFIDPPTRQPDILRPTPAPTPISDPAPPDDPAAVIYE